jgi:hypothetical protein
MQILEVKPDKKRPLGRSRTELENFIEGASQIGQFKQSLSRGHGNFEDQNTFLEPSIIIINDCIIIRAYYNCTVQLIHSIIIILHF